MPRRLKRHARLHDEGGHVEEVGLDVGARGNGADGRAHRDFAAQSLTSWHGRAVNLERVDASGQATDKIVAKAHYQSLYLDRIGAFLNPRAGSDGAYGLARHVGRNLDHAAA